jgi:putative endonuclease
MMSNGEDGFIRRSPERKKSYISSHNNMYFVYLLRCSDNSLYCGQTNNVEKRVKDHNNSKNSSTKYTRGRRPVYLVYFEKAKTITDALRREREIKNLTKDKKEQLILAAKKTKDVISSKSEKNRTD